MSRIYQSKPTTTQSPSNSNLSNSSSLSHSNNLSKSSSTSPPVKLYHADGHHSSSVSPNSQQQQHHNQQSSINEMEKIVTRLETVAQRLEKFTSVSSTSFQSTHTVVSNGSSGSAAAANVDPNVPSVNAFVELINGSLKPFLDYSNQIGSEVKTMGEMVRNVFNLEKALVVEATRSAKPANDLLSKALQPISKQIEEIQAFREKNRRSEFFNHLSSISESIGCVGWVTVSPAPCPYIKEMNDAGQFYTNRVLKDYKDKDPQKLHASWVKSWIQFLNELQAYVKEHFTTGLTWNAKGGALDPSRISTSASAGAASSAPAGPGGPPPPPPPPTYDLFADDPKQSAASSATSQQELQAKLAKELNVGTDITKTLRKVTDDQKTHKNTSLRAGSTVPGGVSQTPSTQKATSVPNKPPKFELQDKKWLVEYQVGKHNLTIDNTEIKQTVYIYQCKECTIKISGKVNSISVDSCDRVGVVFDDVLSTIEFINSKNVQTQVTGKVPTISIDKTDGCQIYLSKQSLEVEIISAKSSAMNVLVPNGDDFVEQPIPEQFKTTLKNSKCITVPTESA